MYWYWYVSWRVCQWKHANTDHNTYQYHPNISAAGVKTNPYWYVLWYVLVCFWYVSVCFGMYLKPFWHTGLRRAQVVLVRTGYVFWYVLTRILWFCIYSARIGRYWSCWYRLCTYHDWYQYTYIHTNIHMCPNIHCPLSPLRAPWWESQEMLWLVADQLAGTEWLAMTESLGGAMTASDQQSITGWQTTWTWMTEHVCFFNHVG